MFVVKGNSRVLDRQKDAGWSNTVIVALPFQGTHFALVYVRRQTLLDVQARFLSELADCVHPAHLKSPRQLACIRGHELEDGSSLINFRVMTVSVVLLLP